MIKKGLLQLATALLFLLRNGKPIHLFMDLTLKIANPCVFYSRRAPSPLLAEHPFLCDFLPQLGTDAPR